jgi:hypothetical protein
MPELMNKHKEEFRNFEKNLKWFQDNYEKLRELYAGEYVAVNNENVVVHGKDARVLIKKLRESHTDIGAFVVEFVSKDKMELIL